MKDFKISEFFSILDSLEEGIMVTDRNYQIVFFNKSASSITGFSQKEAIGRLCFEICGGKFCSTSCDLQKAIEEETPSPFEITINTKEGRKKIIRLKVMVLRDEKGNIKGAIKIFSDVTEQRELERFLNERKSFGSLIGKSKKMQEIYKFIEDISNSNATVLIQGETGTGKELIAEAIHFSSARAEGPLIKVNCSAIPESLLEAELFGFRKGAFTDAKYDKPGKFELADNGTIFLDEIGDISPKLQAKLLRIIENKEFERLGEVKTRKIDVRIIAATNKDLKRLVDEGKFRDDLYYRIAVLKIFVPPLRERKEDIPLLVEHFINKLNETHQKNISGVKEEVMKIFLEYSWPGNVRELINVLEYAFAVCKERLIDVHHIPKEIRSKQYLDENERERILNALESCNWKISECAKILGVHRTTLWRKMRKLELYKSAKQG
jgi:PAS domain S-box-containing protein